jgi:hypothetical protein
MNALSPAIAAAEATWRAAANVWMATCRSRLCDDAVMDAVSQGNEESVLALARTPAKSAADLAAKVHAFLIWDCGDDDDTRCPIEVPPHEDGKYYVSDLIKVEIAADLPRVLPSFYDVPHPDQPLLDAFQEWCRLSAEIYSHDGEAGDWAATPAGAAVCEAADLALDALEAHPATTLQGAIAKLWRSAEMADADREFAMLIARQDLDAIFSRVHDWDGSAQMILLAIAALLGRDPPVPSWVARRVDPEVRIISAFDPEAVMA